MLLSRASDRLALEEECSGESISMLTAANMPPSFAQQQLQCKLGRSARLEIGIRGKSERLLIFCSRFDF